MSTTPASSESNAPALLVQYEDNGVVILTLNKPATRHALDNELSAALAAACADIDRKMDARCVILTASGPTFCSGGNVKEMASGAGMFGGSSAEMRRGYRDNIQRIPMGLYDLEVPVICAINGPAIGAGFDLTLMCDIRIAVPTVQFAESFVRLGLISGDGGAWFLQRTIGRARAAQMTLTGGMVDGRTALDWGIVSELVEPADLMTRAREMAAQIASLPPHSVRLNKRLLREAADMSLPQTLELSRCLQAIVQHTEDHHEAVQAFIGKRPAVFNAK